MLTVVRDIVADVTAWDDAAEPLTVDRPLLEEALIDSLDIVAIVGRLEDRYGRLPASDISVANFASIREIANTVCDAIGAPGQSTAREAAG